jgi:hypothetical protein
LRKLEAGFMIIEENRIGVKPSPALFSCSIGQRLPQGRKGYSQIALSSKRILGWKKK